MAALPWIGDIIRTGLQGKIDVKKPLTVIARYYCYFLIINNIFSALHVLAHTKVFNGYQPTSANSISAGVLQITKNTALKVNPTI